MARLRSIRPEFWSDSTIVKLDFFTRLLYIAMWNFADDHGRNRCLSKEIVGFAFPLDDEISQADVERGIQTLNELGRIILYEVDGVRCYQVKTWLKHQSVNRPTPSRIPEPSEYDHITEVLTEAITEECVSVSSAPVLGSSLVGNRNQEVGSSNRASVPPPAASVAQSAGEPVAEAGIEHALDEQRRKIPPTLEEVRQWFQEWRGRSEVGEKYWEWFNGRGWPRNVDWKAVAYRKAADWCSREDGYIQEEAIKIKSTPPAKKQDIETMTVKRRIDPNDLPPPGWKLGDPIKRTDEEMQAMRDALAPAREKIGRQIPA